MRKGRVLLLPSYIRKDLTVEEPCFVAHRRKAFDGYLRDPFLMGYSVAKTFGRVPLQVRQFTISLKEERKSIASSEL